MKKTVSVNIKGMNFLIEEDAYELLHDYMNRLSHGLRNEKDNKDIIEDIEMRIAELCTTRLNVKKQVIEIEDIQVILDTLGDPSQYLDESVENDQDAHESASHTSTKHDRDRRLFRDLDNATIAGVCSGISNYFGIDVVLVRAIFLIVFFFGGFGIPLYIILWIVVPKAKSTIEKLRMRGKPITVDSVKEEVENASKRFQSETKAFTNRIRREEHWSKRFEALANFIATLFGVLLIIKGLFFLVLLLIFGIFGVRIIPVQSDLGYLSLPELAKMTVETHSDYFWGFSGVMILSLSVIFFLILLGIKLVFKIRSRWSRIGLITLFFTGFIGLFFVLTIGLKSGRELSITGEIEQEIGTYYGEELMLKPHLSTYGSARGYTVKSEGRWGMLGIKGDKIREAGILIHFKPSSDSLYHISQAFSAKSHSHETALKKARNIVHTIAMDSNIVDLNNYFTYPRADKLRLQKVEIHVKIPSGKAVKINNQIIRLGANTFKRQKLDVNYEEKGQLYSDGSYSHWE